MSAFDVAKKYLKKPEAADISEGDIVALLICSRVFEADIWFALRDNWKPDPGDTRAVFYASELPSLRTKTPEQLREIHNVKVAFGPGSRVKQ